MTSVVFSTPGLIPIEAFTVFGMNAKPNSTNPFGFFGTGLKIAIAVCMRMNQEVVIWRGKDKYTFYTRQQDFRGKEFNKIRMKRETWKLGDIFGRPTYIDLPFTTELGKHWELWQAFREFQTNTMDEGGDTHFDPFVEDVHVEPNMSHVVVLGAKFADEYHDRHRNFLPGGLSEREGNERIQVLDMPSKHVYYRGVRVWDLKVESQFTYNFLCHVDLTEDRTAKYPFLLESYIAEYIMESKDEAFLKKVVTSPPSHSFERTMSYAHAGVRPSAYFSTAARESPNINAKEIVKVSETVASSTVITIVVPKSSITDQELHQFKEMCENLWGDIKMDTSSSS